MVSDRGTMAIRPGKKSAVARPIDDPDSDQAPDDNEPDDEGNTASQAEGAGGGQARDRRPEQGQRAPGGGQAAAQAQTPSQGTSLANTGTPPPAVARRLDEEALRAELERRERAAFEQAAGQIRDAIQSDSRLADLARQVSIDQTPEGLRIQLLDEERQPMFATGSAVVADRARLLLQKIAPVLTKLSEDIAITGHTDAAPFRGEGRSNWELSADRANATRRLLVEAGLQEARFRRVTGMADREPLLPADPLAAANRRISILVLRAGRPVP
jgi:chemotaxis protein MotB